MATRWYEDERLSPELRQRTQEVNEKLLARNAELKAQEEQEQAERDRINAEARARYLADLDAKKQAEQARRDAEQEAREAPVKRREMLAWLVDHPGTTEQDFESVWPLKRELLGLDSREAMIEREVSAMRERRGY